MIIALHNTLIRWINRLIDLTYLSPIRQIIPIQTFRYAVCGGGNLALNWVLFALLYNVVLAKQNVDLGLFVLSPYVSAFIIAFPITFFTGFWLQRHIAFHSSPLRGSTQLVRYLFSVAGSVLVNIFLLKFFVEVVHIYPTPSQALTSLISIAYSYLMQKYFTFRGCSKEH